MLSTGGKGTLPSSRKKFLGVQFRSFIWGVKVKSIEKKKKLMERKSESPATSIGAGPFSSQRVKNGKKSPWGLVLAHENPSWEKRGSSKDQGRRV